MEIVAEMLKRGCRHRVGGLARRDDRASNRSPEGGGLQLRKRTLGERARAGRTNARLDDGQGIVSKIVERTGQFKCLGSDQAERPVTTSNFLRRELTTWGALSCVDNCSS